MYRMRMSDSVTIEKCLTKSASHNKTYGTAKTQKCALGYAVQNLNENSGKLDMSSSWIAFPPDADICTDDRVTLPDNSQPHITLISPQVNDITRKTVYIEVYLAKPLKVGGGV